MLEKMPLGNSNMVSSNYPMDFLKINLTESGVTKALHGGTVHINCALTMQITTDLNLSTLRAVAKTFHVNNAVPVISKAVVPLASDTLKITCKVFDPTG
jgi:hypothetical protein